jgi:hypothetical protein
MWWRFHPRQSGRYQPQQGANITRFLFLSGTKLFTISIKQGTLWLDNFPSNFDMPESPPNEGSYAIIAMLRIEAI